MSAQVYVGVEAESGAIVLSNFESPKAHALLLAGVAADAAASPPKPRGTIVRARSRVPAELVHLIDTMAHDAAISPQLLHAVVAAESGYDPRAVSSRGALGLMQLMPATARRFGANDPFSASENISAGVSYLKSLMSLFDNDTELVLAAYNAGEQAVLNAGRRIPPYPETQAYVRRIMSDLDRTALGRR